MRRIMMGLVLLGLAAPATARECPKPTKEETRAPEALARRCVAAGGLEERKDQNTGAGQRHPSRTIFTAAPATGRRGSSPSGPSRASNPPRRVRPS